MSYGVDFLDSFSINPPVKEVDLQCLPPDSSWEISSNGKWLKWKSSDPDAGFRRLELVVTALLERGYRLKGTVRWIGEDEATGTATVKKGKLVICDDEPQSDLSSHEIRRLIENIRSGSDDEQAQAVEILSYFQIDTPDFIAALQEILQRKDHPRRLKITWEVANLGPKAVGLKESLISLFDDPDHQVRAAAAEALGEIGPGASDALPALRKLLDDSNYGPRGRAIEAIRKIEGA